MKYTLTAQTLETGLAFDLSAEADGKMQLFSRWVADTTEQATRARLIEMGWTPPGLQPVDLVQVGWQDPGSGWLMTMKSKEQPGTHTWAYTEPVYRMKRRDER